jgi:GTP-binding protein
MGIGDVMSKPIIAIVGRPNVGKSTLFNHIGKKRVSIVEDIAGVTRDRIYMDAEWLGREFTMVDTGGIELETTDHILTAMRHQAKLAIEEADAVLFVVDAKAGLTSSDQEVAAILRSTRKPVILAVNKVDSMKDKNIEYFMSQETVEDKIIRITKEMSEEKDTRKKKELLSQLVKLYDEVDNKNE